MIKHTVLSHSSTSVERISSLVNHIETKSNSKRDTKTGQTLNWWFSKNGSRPNEGQKMGRAEAIQTWVVYFNRYHCLSLSVCCVGTCEKK